MAVLGWQLDGITFDGRTPDSDGTVWTVETVRGWFGGTTPRADRTQRISGGSYPGSGIRNERLIELVGWSRSPDETAREHAMNKLGALCQGSDLHRLVCLRSTGDLFAGVQLDDRVDPVPQPGGFLVWSLQLAAPDWVKYLLPARPYSTSLPVDAGGLDWEESGAGGLDWGTGGGLDWGTPTSTGRMVLSNDIGTADTWPKFTIVGPVTNPVLLNVGTGEALAYGGALLAGDSLVIDTHPLRRSVTLNGTIDRRSSLAAQWFPVPRGGTVEVSFTSGDVSPPAAAAASAVLYVGIA
jgi:hypothetical protein